MLRPGLTHQSRRELIDVVRGVAADAAVRAVVLTGTGRAFCVGQDLGQHVEALRGNAATSLSVVEDEYNPLVLALAGLRVPVVVGVNGACAGAGLGIALAGDLRVAAAGRSEEHTSELQSRQYLVCRLLLEKKNTTTNLI